MTGKVNQINKRNSLERYHSEQNENFILRRHLVGSQSLLTMKEEENIIAFIKNRSDSLSSFSIFKL